MASPQIEQLRKQFNGMNSTQKKAFITNLKQKLQGNANAEYTKFLNECVQQYNTAVRGGSAAPVQTSANDNTHVAAKGKQKNPLMGAIIFLSVVVVALLIGGGAFILSTLNNSNTGTGGIVNNPNNGSVSDKNDNETILGEWVETDEKGRAKKTSGIDIKWADEYENSSDARIRGKIDFTEKNADTYIFRRDGSYTRIIPTTTAKGFIKPDNIAHEGTYELKGNVLTLYPNTESEKEYEIKIENGTLYLDGRLYR